MSKKLPTIPRYYTAEGFKAGEGTLESAAFFAEQDNTSRAAELSHARNQAHISNHDGKPMFLCGCCHRPLIISGGGEDCLRKYHFKHYKGITEGCLFSDNKAIKTKDEIARVVFNGRQEGPEHRRIKAIFHDILGNEFGPENVRVEQRIKMGGRNWRKPDVNVDTPRGNIAFEIQLAPISINDITERNKAYRSNNRYIIWIFNDFTGFLKSKFWQRDAADQNAENFFVFDSEMEVKSLEEGVLYLKVWYHDYYITDQEMKDDWKYNICRLCDLEIDKVNNLMYSVNSEDLKNHVLKKLSNSNNRVPENDHEPASNHEDNDIEAIEYTEDNAMPSWYEAYNVLSEGYSFSDFHLWALVNIESREQLDMLSQLISAPPYDYTHKELFFKCLTIYEIYRNIKSSIKKSPVDGISAKTMERYFSNLQWHILRICSSMQKQGIRISAGEWNDLNIIFKLREHLSAELLIAFYGIGYTLTDSDKEMIDSNIQHMLENANDLSSERKDQYFCFILAKILDFVYLNKERFDFNKYAQKISKEKTFLKIIFSIWHGVNITNYRNFAEMTNYIKDKRKDYSMTFIKVLYKSQKRQLLQASDTDRHLIEIRKYSQSIQPPKEIREIVTIMLNGRI